MRRLAEARLGHPQPKRSPQSTIFELDQPPTDTLPSAMTEPEDFISYAFAVDELIAKASKEQLAEVAKLLALNIGWYHQRYGDVPQDELLAMVKGEMQGDDGKRLLLHGMENLISALAEVMRIGEDGEEQERH